MDDLKIPSIPSGYVTPWIGDTIPEGWIKAPPEFQEKMLNSANYPPGTILIQKV